MTEYRIRNTAKENKIECFIKATSFIKAIELAAYSLSYNDEERTQLFAETVTAL